MNFFAFPAHGWVLVNGTASAASESRRAPERRAARGGDERSKAAPAHTVVRRPSTPS
jgi:hypothetical protein